MTEEAMADTGAEQSTPSPAQAESSRPQLVADTTQEADVTTDITPESNPTQAEQSDFAVPDEYKEKGWSEKIKSQEDLWKQVDNLQALVGKKAIVPNPETATEAELDNFYNELRPEAYTLPEGSDESVGEMFTGWAKEAGLSQHQFEKAAAAMNAQLTAKHEGERSEEGYKEMIEKTFGKDEGLKSTAENILRRNLSPEALQFVDTLPNDALGVLYQFAKNVHNEYGVSETGAAVNDGAVNSAVGLKERRAELKSKIAEAEKKPFGGDEAEKYRAEYKKVINEMHRRGIE